MQSLDPNSGTHVVLGADVFYPQHHWDLQSIHLKAVPMECLQANSQCMHALLSQNSDLFAFECILMPPNY